MSVVMRIFVVVLMLLVNCFQYSNSLKIPSNLKKLRNNMKTKPLSANIAQDIAATSLSTGLATVLLSTLTKLAKEDIIDSKLCRKLIHTLSAPAFIIVWPLFSSSEIETRVIASLLPLLQIGRLIYSATSKSSILPTGDPNNSKTLQSSSSTATTLTAPSNNSNGYNLADAISRSGNRQEAFGGPLYYVTAILISILIYFRDSPIGVVALCQLAVGDGLADIIGRRFGQVKWPGMKNKSIAGSTAFLFGAFFSSIALLQWLVYTGCLSYDVSSHILPLLIISISCMLIELIPFIDDNISIPLASILLSYLLL